MKLHAKITAVWGSLKIVRLTILLALFASVAACGSGDPAAEATSLADDYMNARIAKSATGLEDDFTHYFMQPLPANERTLKADKIRRNHGKPLSYKQRNISVNENYENKEGVVGAQVSFNFSVAHEEGEIIETLQIFKPKGESEFKIYGHQYFSSKLSADKN